MVIDTHCHIELDDDISNMEDNYMITNATNLESCKIVLELCSKYKNIFGALGIHPEEVLNYNENDLKFVEDNLKNDKIVALGEIGLDYHYDKTTKEQQKELFIKQLDLARKYNKAVIIHSRDAIQDTYDILKNYKDLRKDLHCYSGSLEMAKEFIKINTKLGIGGVLTFKNASNLIDIVENLDLSNFVLETDSPYLAPEPYRGQKNIPYYVNITAKKLADIKQIDVQTVNFITTSNAKELFDLNI